MTIGQATLSMPPRLTATTRSSSSRNAGPNVDQIVMEGLSGLTATQLDSLFDLATSDVNLDGTLIRCCQWTGGSLAVLGTSQWGTSVNAFFTSSQVHRLIRRQTAHTKKGPSPGREEAPLSCAKVMFSRRASLRRPRT